MTQRRHDEKKQLSVCSLAGRVNCARGNPQLRQDSGGCAEGVGWLVLSHTWKFSNANWDGKPRLKIRSNFLAQFYCKSK